MTTMTRPDEREPVKHGQTLGYDELRDEAAKAFSLYGKTRTALAAELDVGLPAVSMALTKTGGSYAALQRRIINRLTGFRVESPPLFRVVSKDADDASK